MRTSVAESRAIPKRTTTTVLLPVCRRLESYFQPTCFHFHLKHFLTVVHEWRSAKVVVLWQREGHKRVIECFFRDLRMTACGDDQILLAIHTVSHRRGTAACWKLRLPKFFSRFDIKRTNKRVKS